ncbi:antizyme inhibitor 1-like isoform X1 [Conger conger]|uniref:antizyme inhibitor 1-like isoform X1 n=1 Tax=Conger conger TaxID=82655 RepID=UPI002A5A38FC|nr:antizyme inhibitor 1-like isoform X1 [Conger conger]XP_061098494.1 antizyme inhibitor 1-like isoform X1 [Conger conger]
MKGLADEPNYSIELLGGGATLKDVIDTHVYEQALAEKNAFFVADLGVVTRQHVRWRAHMPSVRPFYPVRCNSSPAVIEILATLGAGFVCTSKNEVVLVQSYGVAPENIMLGGVCKQLSLIKYAAKSGINLLVCDNETELRKIARCHPTAMLLLQVATEAHGEGEETCMAFGSTLKSCRHLLECAKELGMQVVGAKFHVPTCCTDPQAYTHAVSDARCVFDMGEELGFSMKILDIGGGFSGSEVQLEQVHGSVTPLLDMYFPSVSGVALIAEPGGYYVSSAFTLAVNIIGKEVVARDQHGQPLDALTPNDEPEFLYYMSDGVFGSFGCKLLDHTIPAPSLHKKAPLVEEPVFASSLWGPSCDSLDQVVEHCLLPELSVGDWLVFSAMGAHSLGEPSALTDTQEPPVYYVISTDDWYEMQDAGITLDSTMKNFSLVPCSFQFSPQADAFSTLA